MHNSWRGPAATVLKFDINSSDLALTVTGLVHYLGIVQDRMCCTDADIQIDHAKAGAA